MIVLDASAAVSALVNNGEARGYVAAEVIHVPHLVDVEIVSALRRHAAAGTLSDAEARGAVNTWASLGVIRYAAMPLVDRVWQLRASVSAYDAVYVALAENLGCELVTADRRLAGANGMNCSITLVPN